MLGKEVRMRRLFNARSGKFLAVAVDHATAYGVIPGIDSIAATMERIVNAGPDAVTMTKGIANKVFRPFAGQLPAPGGP